MEKMPLALSFSFSDPTSASGVQSDMLTFASMGCHGLSTLTGFSIGDSASCEDFQAIDEDWVSDQARVLLEDMPIAAIKIGETGSAENTAMIAEIAADYPELPLVFAPLSRVRHILSQHDDLAFNELLALEANLILPQSTLAVLTLEQAARYAFPEQVESDLTDPMALAEPLLGLGCEFVLLLGATVFNLPYTSTLISTDGQIRQDVWDPPPYTFLGAEDILSAAITALLANGMEMGAAVAEAHEYLKAALQQANKLGMGQPMPDRFFWAKNQDT